MGVYIKNITKDDLAENGALMWGKRIIFIPPEDIIPVQDNGDLIDRDKLIYELGEEDEDLSTYHTLLYAPVVIPAERTADLCDACGKADKENCSYCEKMERSKE